MSKKFARAFDRHLPSGEANDSETNLQNLPSVAVIIPAYNSENFIGQAVSSALSSRGVSVSVLVVDDDSSDMTVDIVRRFCAQDDRVQMLTNRKNFGSYVCRNIGIQESVSDYLAFLDSDDIQHPDRLRYQISQIAENSRAKATYCRLRRWDSSFRYPVRDLRLGFVTSVFHRNLIDEVGFFDSVRFGADAEFHDRLLARFGPKGLKLLPNELYFARFREESVTSSGEGQIFYRTGNRRIRFKKSETRNQYRDNFRQWHRSAPELHIGFPLESRPFPVGGQEQEVQAKYAREN